MHQFRKRPVLSAAVILVAQDDSLVVLQMTNASCSLVTMAIKASSIIWSCSAPAISYLSSSNFGLQSRLWLSQFGLHAPLRAARLAFCVSARHVHRQSKPPGQHQAPWECLLMNDSGLSMDSRITTRTQVLSYRAAPHREGDAFYLKMWEETPSVQN